MRLLKLLCTFCALNLAPLSFIASYTMGKHQPRVCEDHKLIFYNATVEYEFYLYINKATNDKLSKDFRNLLRLKDTGFIYHPANVYLDDKKMSDLLQLENDLGDRKHPEFRIEILPETQETGLKFDLFNFQLKEGFDLSKLFWELSRFQERIKRFLKENDLTAGRLLNTLYPEDFLKFFNDIVKEATCEKILLIIPERVRNR